MRNYVRFKSSVIHVALFSKAKGTLVHSGEFNIKTPTKLLKDKVWEMYSNSPEFDSNVKKEECLIDIQPVTNYYEMSIEEAIKVAKIVRTI